MWFPATLQRERLADALLAAALGALTFLLGCQELFDADLWWHVRAGRWILEHRAIPRVDPFTYGALGQPWVDLHWLFQVVLALAYERGGVPGTLVLAASGAAAAVLTGFILRDREWPAAVVAAAWVPAVLLASTRFDPRPEIATLIGLSAFFGILLRARRAPGWLWVLVPIQVLWVNTHGLFVLGPWMVLLFLIDRALAGGESPPWRRLWPPSLAVGVACLSNPYGVRGLLLPLELFPKLTEGGGSYKAYIGEFMSVRRFVATYWLPVPGHDIYLRLFVFQLTALPLVYLVTALGRAWRARVGEPGRAGTWAWAGAMAAAAALAVGVAAGLPGATTPAWRIALGRAAPWVLAGAGGAAALTLHGRSRHTALLALMGAGATAGWITWLVGHLYESQLHLGAAAAAVGLGLPAAWLAFKAGTRPFGPLVAASFAALGLLAVRNMSLFALVSGAVLAAELGEWAAMLGMGSGRPGRWTSVAARGMVLVGVAALCALVVTGRYFALAEDCRRFGLRERPFYYAHDACRFARQAGLPEGALVFSLLQAGVYEFHNSPARRVFVDGRLEVVSRETFEAYVRIHQRLTAGDPRWDSTLGRFGPLPLVLADHEDNAAAVATLLTSPRWRCVYFDAVAAVFLPRGLRGGIEASYPTLDFTARHFASALAPGARKPRPESGPANALATARSLERIGAVVAHRPVPAWSLRIPLFLAAMERAHWAVSAEPDAPEPWIVLGHAALGLAGDLAPSRDRLRPGWDLALDLAWAQGSSAYRKAIERDPRAGTSQGILAASLAMRGMSPASEQAALEEVRERRGVLPWGVAERVAATYLHLGKPDQARRAWLAATGPPSEALRLARLADADLAAWDFTSAETGYRRALALDPRMADAWVGLALAALETGSAGIARDAARTARECAPGLETHRRALLDGIEKLCAPREMPGEGGNFSRGPGF
jgi:hypothetical protein